MSVSARSPRPIPLTIAGLILGTVAFLSAGGPFYDRWAKDETIRVTSLYVAGDDRIFTGAGSYDKTLHEYRGSAVDGALVFGPYVALEAGQYAVSWFGTVQQASEPLFEIASMTGGTIAADSPRLAPTAQAARLHTVHFSLPRAVEGVEFRVIVKRTDALAVRAIELTALSPTPRQP